MEEVIRLKVKERLSKEDYEIFLESNANNCLMSMLLFIDEESE